MAKRVFTDDYKKQILKQLQPPENKTIPEIAVQENIPKTTIYGWVSKARRNGQIIPNNINNSSDSKWLESDKYGWSSRRFLSMKRSLVGIAVSTVYTLLI